MSADVEPPDTPKPEPSWWAGMAASALANFATIILGLGVLATIMVVYVMSVSQMEDSNEIAAALTQVFTVISTLTAVLFGVRAGAQGKEKLETNLMESMQAMKAMSSARVSDMKCMSDSLMAATERMHANELSALNASIEQLIAETARARQTGA